MGAALQLGEKLLRGLLVWGKIVIAAVVAVSTKREIGEERLCGVKC